MTTQLATLQIQHPVQIPAADGGSTTIGTAATAAEARKLAAVHGVHDSPELFARTDTFEWHVGF